MSTPRTLDAAIKSAKPAVTIGTPVQDILAAGDNTSAVVYTVSMAVCKQVPLVAHMPRWLRTVCVQHITKRHAHCNPRLT